MTARNPLFATVPFVLLILAVACGKDNERAAAAPKKVAAPEPWFTTADNCGFDATANHSNPEALVRDYVQRDQQGAFLRSDAWFNAAVECPSNQRSPLDYVVVASSEVVPIRTNGDTARIGVRYRLLGSANPDGYRPDLKTVTDTVKLARSKYGWRIIHAPSPHVTVDVAKKHQTFTRADLWAIDASVTQARRLAPR